MAAAPASIVTFTLRNLLKQSTGSAHSALERLPLIRALLEDRLSTDQYGEYLRRQHQLHAPLEAALWQWATPDWRRLRLVKTTWLGLDLQTLGVSTIGCPAQVPQVASYAQAVGVMYVLEGSTLGSQVIRKRIRPDHIAVQGADIFLRGYESQTGHLWSVFLEELEALPPAQWPQATDAALATFAAFELHFSQASDGQ